MQSYLVLTFLLPLQSKIFQLCNDFNKQTHSRHMIEMVIKRFPEKNSLISLKILGKQLSLF